MAEPLFDPLIFDRSIFGSVRLWFDAAPATAVWTDSATPDGPFDPDAFDSFAFDTGSPELWRSAAGLSALWRNVAIADGPFDADIFDGFAFDTGTPELWANAPQFNATWSDA